MFPTLIKVTFVSFILNSASAVDVVVSCILRSTKKTHSQLNDINWSIEVQKFDKIKAFVDSFVSKCSPRKRAYSKHSFTKSQRIILHQFTSIVFRATI